MLHPVESMQALKSLLGLPLSFPSCFNTGNAGKKISCYQVPLWAKYLSYMISSESHNNVDRAHYCPHLAGKETEAPVNNWPQVTWLLQLDSLRLQLLVLSSVSCSWCLPAHVLCSVRPVLRQGFPTTQCGEVTGAETVCLQTRPILAIVGLGGWLSVAECHLLLPLCFYSPLCPPLP